MKGDPYIAASPGTSLIPFASMQRTLYHMILVDRSLYMITGGRQLMRLNFSHMHRRLLTSNLSQFKCRWCRRRRRGLFFVYVFAAVSYLARTITTTTISSLSQRRLVFFCRFSPANKALLYVFFKYSHLKRSSHLIQYTYKVINGVCTYILMKINLDLYH